MQSLSRQLRRGNAVIVMNHATKQTEVVHKKGTFWKRWKNAVKNRMENAENELIELMAKKAV